MNNTKTRIVSKFNIKRGDLVLLPEYYVEIGGMKAIVLDLYDGQPDENNDIYECCRLMLEDGTFENLETFDLILVESLL